MTNLSFKLPLIQFGSTILTLSPLVTLTFFFFLRELNFKGKPSSCWLRVLCILLKPPLETSGEKEEALNCIHIAHFIPKHLLPFHHSLKWHFHKCFWNKVNVGAWIAESFTLEMISKICWFPSPERKQHYKQNHRQLKRIYI